MLSKNDGHDKVNLGTLDSAARAKIGRRLIGELPGEQRGAAIEDILDDAGGDLDPAKRGAFALKALQALPEDQQEQVIENLGLIPDPPTTNTIFLITVCAFAVVLIASAAFLAVGLFIRERTPMVRPEVVLTLFTGATGFLAGLLIQSPAQATTAGGVKKRRRSPAPA